MPICHPSESKARLRGSTSRALADLAPQGAGRSPWEMHIPTVPYLPRQSWAGQAAGAAKVPSCVETRGWEQPTYGQEHPMRNTHVLDRRLHDGQSWLTGFSETT